MLTLNALLRQAAAPTGGIRTLTTIPHQQHAVRALMRCRTAALGGHVLTCPQCPTTRYAYHSCRNRHCPTCQYAAGQAWLAAQQQLLLPVPYFLVTFTIPAELRHCARTNQRQVYGAMFRASSAALQALAADPRLLGGQLGLLGVLQTWTRDLRYHPHIHYLVPAVGRAADGRIVFPPTATFLLPVRPLAALYRGKLHASLRQYGLTAAIPSETWHRPWVVDCRPVGSGATALTYLAPYIFRVALSNNRILAADATTVTFRYRQRESREQRTCTLPTGAFLQRFLEHILPGGFVKVRYYGLFSPSQRGGLAALRAQLALYRREDLLPAALPLPTRRIDAAVRCPHCGTPMLRQRLAAQWERGPPARGPATGRAA